MSKDAWGWGWNASVDNDSDGNLVITMNKDYGAGSSGFGDGKDLSKYSVMEFDFVSVTSTDPWHQIIIKDASDKEGTAVSSIEKGEHKVTVTLSELGIDLKTVKQFSVQGKFAGDKYVLKAVTIK